MRTLNDLLLILHFIGLALGFSVGIANAVMVTLIAKAPPQERSVLARFLPMMSRVGAYGLALLWITGLALLFRKFGGFANMPWQFHVKITAVVLLSLTVGYIQSQQAKARRGDLSAVPRIELAGTISMPFALVALIFAVLTFH